VNFKSLQQKTDASHTGELIADDENPFSTNKVTGYSLNYPIAQTCSPTNVCVKTCYFGRGPSTWTAALRKQWRLYNSTTADPEGTAKRIAHYAGKLRLPFVRWNGGGDLFRESVECINHAAPLMPGIPQWVVTRLAHHAVNIAPAANVFVHFSLDGKSWTRAAAMRQYAGNWFWSYQCDAGEMPPKSLAPVVFYDGYDPGSEPLNTDDCPLNAAEDITGTCAACRRCFDGSAVARGRELRSVLDSQIDAT
jgi:hypothetical protein